MNTEQTNPKVSALDTGLKVGGIVLLAALLVAVGIVIGSFLRPAWYPAASGQAGPFGSGMMGNQGMMNGPGMMGGNYNDGGLGNGMMGGSGMMNGYVPDADLAPKAGEQLTLDQAFKVAVAYAARYGENLEVAEVMAFTNHFYAEIHEKDTGIGAFEILIDPLTAAVWPEPGPNMMWSTKYGMMGSYGGGMMGGYGNGMMGGSGVRGGYVGNPSGEMTVTPDQAIEYAQATLDRALPGTDADEPEPFYGYYTLHVTRDGQNAGMLSVNGYTGEVWLHTWHGDFVDMKESGD